ncbi:putative ABC transporter ATP-binding protein [bioreactor metagenome]|uniref:Putative ABC transporter ATP-binding protein n=1 Tax=bioreactor metagenome TaxID=1076179 RepID=A0A645A697_9ZZZZ
MKGNIIWQSVIDVLRKRFFLLLLLFLAIVFSMALQLTPAFLIRRIIDQHFVTGQLAGVWSLAALYLLVTSGSNVVEFSKVAFTTLIGQSILMDLRSKMAKRLTELPIDYFLSTPTGDIMSRLTTDVDAIHNLFSAGIINVFTNLFKIGGLLVSLYIMAPQLIWLEIVVIPIVYFASNFFRKRIFVFQKTVRLRISAIYTFIQEWISGIRTVKAYSAEKIGKKKFHGLLLDLLNTINKISTYDSWFPCVMQILRACVIVTALWVCAPNGTALSLGLTVGTLAAVIDLIGKLFSPIEALATEFQTIQQSMAGIARVQDFFKENVEVRIFKDQRSDDSGIVIENLKFAYGNTPVLNNISLHIEKGEKAVFIGRSGAGKTTLLNLVSGIYAPLEGSIRVCGVDPFALPPEQRRRLIGIVPQMPQIFDGTIAENITLRDRTISQALVEEAAKVVGIHDLITQMPNAYETIIGEGAVGLSSGEIQLLSIARAIAANPKVLLLDEPTSGMDTQTESRIFAAIRATSEGRTIFSISHRLSGMIDADVIHIVAQNGIVESGSPEQLAKQNGWYAMYSRIDNAGWDLR